jgi:hypothetical protein
VKTYRHLTSPPSLLQTSKHLCVFNPNGDLSWVIKNCYWGEAEETRRKHPKNPSGWDGAIRILAPLPNTSLFDMHSLPSPNLNFKNQSEKRPEFSSRQGLSPQNPHFLQGLSPQQMHSNGILPLRSNHKCHFSRSSPRKEGMHPAFLNIS